MELASRANFSDHYLHYATFVGNDESTAISKLHKEVSQDIEKWSDIVQVKRSLGKILYDNCKNECSSLKRISPICRPASYIVSTKTRTIPSLWQNY